MPTRSAPAALRARPRGAARAVALAAALIVPAPLGLAAPAIGKPRTAAKTRTTTSSADLRSGSRGPQVRALQRALGLKADGVFGARTKTALKRFQRAHGLKADGVAGAATRKALGLGATGSGRRQTTDSSGGSSPDDLPSAADPSADAPQTLPIADVTADGEDPTASSGEASGAGAEAIAAARDALGTPYASAGTTTAGFDCSGLTQWAFGKAGVDLPRSSFEQYGEGTSVAKADIRPGDLVFFDTAGAGASHVGIALGGGKVISATTGGVAQHAIDDDYWGAHYVGARRVA